MRPTFLVLILFLLNGCLGIPNNIKPVDGLDAQRYLGTWYEIARLDHPFERGLEQISATYSLKEDGGITVINRGYETEKQRWKVAEGKAYFIGQPTVGQLKVSFFGPFYGAYNIIDLDPQYQHALVCGPDYSYLWILSRTPKLSDSVLSKLVDKAKSLGFNTDKLVYVKH